MVYFWFILTVIFFILSIVNFIYSLREVSEKEAKIVPPEIICRNFSRNSYIYYLSIVVFLITPVIMFCVSFIKWQKYL